MSLLTKLERLERMASFRHGALEVSAELVEDLRRILEEGINRPKPTTLEGQIAEVRQRIAEIREASKLNETEDEPWKSFSDDLNTLTLTMLEGELAKLTESAKAQ